VTHFVFEINGFNEVDHLSPVAHQLLTRQHRVTFITLDYKPQTNEPRIKHLFNFTDFNLLCVNEIFSNFQLKIFQKLLRLFFGRYTRHLTSNHTRLNLLTKVANLLGLLRVQPSFDPGCVISGWGDPTSQLCVLGRLRCLPVIGLPHGYPCVKNSNFNPHISKIIESSKQLPDFSLRNHFTRYVVATERNKRMLQDWSMSPAVIETWGNLRFSPEWVFLLQKMVPEFQFTGPLSGAHKVLMFLPSSGSNFKSSELKHLLSELAREKIDLVLKPHTREGQDLSRVIPNHLWNASNVRIASNYDSTALMLWAETVINFATGTALEALIINKRLVFAKYLTTNQLSWEDCGGIVIAESEKVVIDSIRDRDWRVDQSAAEPYLKQELFVGGIVQDPLTYCAERLELLAGDSQR